MSFLAAISKVLVLAILVWGSQSAAEEPASIEPAELAAKIASGSAPYILDVRTSEEFATGHIPGAISVPHDELGDRLSSLDLATTQEIVVHCERGGRAAAAESVLRSAGYTRVRDLDGHMQAWRAQGRPLE